MMFKSSFERAWAEEARIKQAIAGASLHKGEPATPLHAAAEAAVNAGASQYPDGTTHHHGPWCYPDGKMPVSEDKPRDLQDQDPEDVEKGRKRRLRELAELHDSLHADEPAGDGTDPSVMPCGQPEDPPGPAEMVGVPDEQPGDADVSPDAAKAYRDAEPGPAGAPSPGSAPSPRSLGFGAPGTAHGGFPAVSPGDFERYSRPLPGN